MMHSNIIRLNNRRFKQMLETETNESSRQTIEGMLRKFEGSLTSSELEKRRKVSSQPS